MAIKRSVKRWVKTLSDEEVFNREFSIGYLIQTNQHLEFFKELKEKVLSNYKVVARFTYLGYNGDQIWANGQKLVFRRNKRYDFELGEDVTMIEHNLSHKGGGSNQYPSVAYMGAYCIIEFISYGLPFVDSVEGWSIEIIKLEKIE